MDVFRSRTEGPVAARGTFRRTLSRNLDRALNRTLHRNLRQTILGGLVLLALSLLPVPTQAAGSILAAPGIRVISSENVLVYHTQQTPDGELLFEAPGGAMIRLITTPDDPEITNPGDGLFYPVDVEPILDAILAIPSELLLDLEVDIFVLPYPRAGFLSSSADSRAIYLSPGVRPYATEQIHYLVAHEIGHVVHRQHLPDSDLVGWSRYATLRGIADTERFSSDAEHAYRPHEVFAEDFRVLFGGEIARGDGSVENREIALPGDVPGLNGFFRGLIGGESAATVGIAERIEWRLAPNPLFAGGQLLLRAGDLPVAGDQRIQAAVFDVSGRQVRDLGSIEFSGDGWDLGFDGRDARGSLLPSGAYWVRVRTDDATVRTLPLRWVR